MNNIFKKADIKAGYLLRVKNGDKEFNMTVAPTKAYTAPFIAHLILGEVDTAAGDLACCGADHWWPVKYFNDDLETRTGDQVVAVYGYTTVGSVLDNSTRNRELLWERDAPKRMTLEEIEKALGYQVKVVETGDTAPVMFKKSNMCAGMVVQLRNGEKRVVVPTENGLVLANGCGRCVTVYNPLKSYRDDLTFLETNATHLDVVKVWGRVVDNRDLAFTFSATDEGRDLLWERDEPKRMTLEEVEKTLGYPVEIVEG